MKTAKIFKNGQSQAVRLPKEFRMAGKLAFVKKVREGLLILPEKGAWGILENSLGHFTSDFMEERGQPAMQKRKGL
ncbi:MAG: AbrB/MazE/SpoVT family DNA-binding domain-containing protein [Nitrospinae bacterium]|nr:AbrB/MazE/SpoVT family DNA-binding domain-containing protein [Nitrospinota bacterium]